MFKSPKNYVNNKTTQQGASLVVQWLRICLAMPGHGFDPWSRKIPHASGQLSSCATTTEDWGPRAHATQQEKLLPWQAHALQLEKARERQQRQSTANKQIKEKNSTRAKQRWPQWTWKLREWLVSLSWQRTLRLSGRTGRMATWTSLAQSSAKPWGLLLSQVLQGCWTGMWTVLLILHLHWTKTYATSFRDDEMGTALTTVRGGVPGLDSKPLLQNQTIIKSQRKARRFPSTIC